LKYNDFSDFRDMLFTAILRGTMRVVTVIPLLANIPYEELSYFSKQDIHPGDLVEITIHNRVCKGVVTTSSPVEEERQNLRNASFNLKKISKVIMPEFLPGTLWHALVYLSSYLLVPVGVMLHSLLSQKRDDDIVALHTQQDPRGHELLLLEQGYEHRLARYKTTIRELFSKKKSLIIFFPTITDLSYAEKELSRGIEEYVFSVHGNLSEKIYRDHVQKIQSTDHPLVILATPSIIPWVRKDLGLIIIEREHSTYYYTHGEHGYDMRFVIKTLAEKSGIPCLLGSHTLSLAAHLSYKQKNATELIPLQYRNDFPIRIVKMTKENITGNPFLSKQALSILHEMKKLETGHVFYTRTAKVCTRQRYVWIADPYLLVNHALVHMCCIKYKAGVSTSATAVRNLSTLKKMLISHALTVAVGEWQHLGLLQLVLKKN
jgi:primosomal protein N'